MNVLATWLAQKSGLKRLGDPLPHYLSRDPSNLEILSELVYKNGGSWNVQKLREPQEIGPYGRLGFLPEELFLFLELRGFVNGLVFANCGTEQELFDAIKAEVERVDGSIQETVLTKKILLG